ncbi:MAG: hypothetical protein IPP22_08715 [Nitrosomonas sp.]|nr:hypothetical protein [Nitrosomonas sp.]
MGRKIQLGSPSFVKAGLSKCVKEVFGGAEYPIRAVILNHMPRDITLPELGLFLKHVGNSNDEDKRIAVIGDLERLLRLESNISQIAFLNGYDFAALTVEELVDEPEQDGGQDGGGQETDQNGDDGDQGSDNYPETDGETDADKDPESAGDEEAEAEAKAEAEAEAEAARVQAELDSAAEKAKADAEKEAADAEAALKAAATKKSV